MTDQAIALGDFQPQHLEAAHALSRAAGWPHRREDWAMMLALSRGCVALAGGEVVGTILLTPFGPVATINMVIVAARLRGRGLGRRLMGWALDSAGGAECRLVATPQGLPLYETLGFLPCGEIVQHQGAVRPLAAAAGGVAWAGAADLGGIAALDQAATSMARAPLLAHLAGCGRFARAGEEGFAALRTFGRGEVAGPVIATEPGVARDLLAFLFAQRIGCFLRVDTPADRGLSDWLAASGLMPVDRVVAMRRAGAAPAAASPVRPRVFALASQALG